jgi:hypothetical protein
LAEWVRVMKASWLIGGMWSSEEPISKGPDSEMSALMRFSNADARIT